MRTRGQAVVLVALLMPFLMAMLILVIEAGWRYSARAEIEDALQHATRSAVQRLDYAELARGRADVIATSACRRVTLANAPSACRALITLARDTLVSNLQSVGALTEPPLTAANRVVWTVLPSGGTCSFSAPLPSVTVNAPLLCAEWRPTLEGAGFWGDFRPLVYSADTIDTLLR